MPSIIGIDSRIFVRESKKKNGDEGHFRSVLGIAVKVRDYTRFNDEYKKAMDSALSAFGLDNQYQYYCTNDLIDSEKGLAIIEEFSKRICPHIEKVHIFYTLFSKKDIGAVKVYGRLAHRNRLKLSTSTRTYPQLIEYLSNCFPAICAWRLTPYLYPGTVQFHLDSYNGHICEAVEELAKSRFDKLVYPNGDCLNPIISTADLLIHLLDKRLELQNKFLIFDNIRPALSEFGENVLVYPIHNRYLPKITPLDTIPIETIQLIKHPVFWVFKGDSLIDSGTMKRSPVYRNLIDYASDYHGTVKMFEKTKDVNFIVDGDRGVFINDMGKQIVETYVNLGKKIIPFDMKVLVPKQRKV
jgi:uncharacterized protein YlaN (UPF0358 family)